MADPDVIHIAGAVVQVGTQHRQRCSWCGAVIEDLDLALMAVPDDQTAAGVPSWPVGELVAVAGGMKWLVDHADGNVLPAGCCAHLPHDVTGHVAGGGAADGG